MTPTRIAIWVALTGLALAACGSDRNPGQPVSVGTGQSISVECASAGSVGTCAFDNYPNRPYEVHVPTGYSPEVSIPLWIDLHGGGGSIDSASIHGCAGGDRTEAGCIHSIGEIEGFITVYPSGTGGRLATNLRTWNGGGGADGSYCASGRACREDIDDITYLATLLDELEAQYSIDTSRVYVSGLSNGAALAHRVACEMSDRITAIAAVGGANQFANASPCEPERPIPVLQIHGTADPCWHFDRSEDACVDRAGGERVGVMESTQGWATRNGCAPDPIETPLTDRVDDGTNTDRLVWSSCAANIEVALLRVNGGGHTWPDGHNQLGVDRLGLTTRDWGSELIWEFFERFAIAA